MTCPDCDGWGVDRWRDLPCLTCYGHGRVTRRPMHPALVTFIVAVPLGLVLALVVSWLR